MVVPPTKTIEKRLYQARIVAAISYALKNNRNLLVELDAGLGKRIISYLLSKHLRNERILIITPSQASLRDTVNTFLELYKAEGLNKDELGWITAGVPSFMRRKILEKKRVVIATPISLANVLRKHPHLINNFELIIINEIDKVVRRVSEEAEESEEVILESAKTFSPDRVKALRKLRLTYPWNELCKLFPKDACIVGMSGTLRDQHLIRTKEGVVLKPEIDTIIENFFPKNKELDIITMDDLIRRTDAGLYVVRNLTVIKRVKVSDEKVERILDALTQEIDKTAEKIIGRYPDTFREKNIENVEKAITILPENDLLRIKMLRLALVRKFVEASIPSHYRKFLYRRGIRRIIERITGEKLENLIPEESSKINKIVEIMKDWISRGEKVVILTSYIRVAERIRETITKEGFGNVFLITGRTFNKGEVLSSFKNINEPAILIMTPVGERDIDLSDVGIIIVHDIISTVKTMYQRIKRGRRCFVIILHYGGHEEKKVLKLLERMQRKYPWSIRIHA
ncbi:MAG: DEAD/DEAH box helicase [Candidatus Njordarchaeales archaeon]